MDKEKNVDKDHTASSFLHHKWAALVFILIFLLLGVFIGLLIGKIIFLVSFCEVLGCVTPGIKNFTVVNSDFCMLFRDMVFEWTNREILKLFHFLAYMVQEQHYFMETVELKGLQYNSDLQDDDSAFSVVLSATLKSKVRASKH